MKRNAMKESGMNSTAAVVLIVDVMIDSSLATGKQSGKREHCAWKAIEEDSTGFLGVALKNIFYKFNLFAM